MSEFSIRPATQDDLVTIVEIESRVHKAPWSLDHFKTEIEKPYSNFWVLTDDETDTQVAGYIVFWVMSEEGHILNIATDIAYRGMGYAQHLVRMAVKQALKQSANKMILEVRKSNQAAVSLYQKIGFTISRIQKNSYSDGEDAYHMEMSLENNVFPEF